MGGGKWTGSGTKEKEINRVYHLDERNRQNILPVIFLPFSYKEEPQPA
jgi:hypothetical protein